MLAALIVMPMKQSLAIWVVLCEMSIGLSAGEYVIISIQICYLSQTAQFNTRSYFSIFLETFLSPEASYNQLQGYDMLDLKQDRQVGLSLVKHYISRKIN